MFYSLYFLSKLLMMLLSMILIVYYSWQSSKKKELLLPTVTTKSTIERKSKQKGLISETKSTAKWLLNPLNVMKILVGIYMAINAVVLVGHTIHQIGSGVTTFATNAGRVISTFGGKRLGGININDGEDLRNSASSEQDKKYLMLFEVEEEKNHEGFTPIPFRDLMTDGLSKPFSHIDNQLPTEPQRIILWPLFNEAENDNAGSISKTEAPESTGRCLVPLSERITRSDYGKICEDSGCAIGPWDASAFDGVIDNSLYKIDPSIKDEVIHISQDVIGIVKADDQYTDPRSPFFKFVDIPHVNDLGGKRYGIVYVMVELPDVTEPIHAVSERVDCLVIDKAGICTDPEWRLDKYRQSSVRPSSQTAYYNVEEEDFDDPNYLPEDEDEEYTAKSTIGTTVEIAGKKYQMMRIVRHDRLSLWASEKIANKRVEIIQYVHQNEDAPAGQRRLFGNFQDRGWLEVGGGLRGLDRQVVETGAQDDLGLYIQGEAFGWKQVQLDGQNDLSFKTEKEMERIATEVVGVTNEDRSPDVHQEAKGTWPTGADPATLSTETTTLGYILGKDGLWSNLVDYACNPYEEGSTQTEAEVFDYSCYDKDLADKTFCSEADRFYEMSKDGKFRVIDSDNQHWLYKNPDEAVRIYQAAGFTLVDSPFLRTTFGNEIVVLYNNKTMVVLHGHYSVAGDSQDFITAAQMHPRAMTADVVHNFMRWARGEDINKDNYHDNATFGSNAMTYCLEALHGYPKGCAVWYRDSVLQGYDPETLAVDLFKGGKTPRGNLFYVSSKRARHELKHPVNVAKLTVIEVANGLSTAIDKTELWEILDDFDKVIKKYTKSAKKWQQIYSYLKKFITPLGDEFIKEWAEDRRIMIVQGEGLRRERLDHAADPVRQTNKAVEDRMKEIEYNEDTTQYCWAMPQSKAGTYSGPDTKDGWPVFDPQTSHFHHLCGNIKSQVNWKPSTSLNRLSKKEAHRYEGAPLKKGTNVEIRRDGSGRGSDNTLALFRIDPKPTPAACPLPKKSKSKRKALDDKTNTKSKKSTGKKK